MTRLLLPLALFATPAFAASVGEAQFAPGTQLPARVVVGDAIWTCAGERCAGPAETRAVAMQRACLSLARGIGAVSSFSVAGAAMAPEAVQACNAKGGR